MTYFVGIDIAKFHHQCMVINHHGEVIQNSFSFDNDAWGFDYLLSVLHDLDSTSNIKIGFESTGHYAHNLMNFLTKSDYDFMEIHPLLISRFAEASSLRKTKTDKVDAHLICSYLMSVEYKPYSSESYHIVPLKSLTRSRDALVKERSLQLVRLTTVLDSMFPEFKPFFNNSLKSATAQYLLLNYTTPSKMSRLTQSSYTKMKSKLRRTIPYSRFLELVNLAKHTVGTQTGTHVFLLNNYLSLYQSLDTMIQETESQIKMEFSKFKSHIQSIPGISLISAAGIYSEIGACTRFSHPDQLVSFCGLEPSHYQSGESEFNGRMVKRGSSYLRQYIMNSAQFVMIHNPILYDYYQKKRNEGKPHRVALSHLAKKLLRIIYTLELKQIDFDYNQMK